VNQAPGCFSVHQVCTNKKECTLNCEILCDFRLTLSNIFPSLVFRREANQIWHAIGIQRTKLQRRRRSIGQWLFRPIWSFPHRLRLECFFLQQHLWDRYVVLLWLNNWGRGNDSAFLFKTRGLFISGWS